MPGPVLLLDVMETLVSEPFREIVPRFFGVPLEALIREKDPSSWIEFEHGRIDEDAYIAAFFRDRRPVDKHALKAIMSASYEWLEGVEELLAELKSKGVPMYALSNYSSWYELIEAKLGLGRYIEWTFVSCRTGHRKPDPEAYRVAVRTLGVSPDECVFVDDRMTNVRAAEAVGMRAIHRVPGIEKLRADLSALSII